MSAPPAAPPSVIEIAEQRPARPARTLLGMFPEELAALLGDMGQPRYRALQVFHWLHQRQEFDLDQMTDLPASLRQALRSAPPVTPGQVIRTLQSADTLTRKLLLSLGDSQEIEAVEMNTRPEGDPEGRKTICVSSQAGCAMACVFCVTGQFGFARNLEAGEIVEQVLRFQRAGRPVTNVVFMGMGEPMANYDEVLRAVRLLTHPEGLHLGARRITISTSGLVPQIRRLATEGLQVGLAISLHAPDDALRSSLMPVNKRWPIREVLAAADAYASLTGRRVSYEYTLMDGVNDADEQADALARLLQGRLAHVNLIPLNPTEDPSLRAPSMERARSFQRRLDRAGMRATVRVNRGRDILAACGQLRLTERRRNQALAASS
ncbi:MAG: 23S rRNA (adenine(2503)-C(2))-methyltransferase RlmN [Chloroflexi bacterium]|nr:23S rRNA (adenine(2503)-C(2))-methyltransferase RlmN [Chloroflexota bacterium]